MRQDEQCVRDLVSCIDEFDTFPFNPASTALRTLQSAMPASDELVADFKSAHAAGEEKLAIFLQERVFSKNTSLHAPVRLSKRLTFATAPCKETAGVEYKARAGEMERSALKAVIDLVEVSQLVDLSELFEFKWHVQKDAEEQSTSEALTAICIYSGKIYSTC